MDKTNLVIDIGNSRIKVAVFEDGKIVERFFPEVIDTSFVDKIKRKYSGISNAIVSNVRTIDGSLMSLLNSKFDVVVDLDQNTPLPIEICYETPDTLGKDRVAAAVGANSMFPNQNVVVIDAGTAVTYDFVDRENRYQGGFISPGLNMRFNALHRFTGKLPLIEPEFSEKYEGKNTHDAISGGVQYGLEGEIERMISFFNVKNEGVIIILTGGDANYFERIVKRPKFVTLDLNYIGLNRILDFVLFKKLVI